MCSSVMLVNGKPYYGGGEPTIEEKVSFKFIRGVSKNSKNKPDKKKSQSGVNKTDQASRSSSGGQV